MGAVAPRALARPARSAMTGFAAPAALLQDRNAAAAPAAPAAASAGRPPQAPLRAPGLRADPPAAAGGGGGAHADDEHLC